MERGFAVAAGLGAFTITIARAGRLLETGSGQRNWAVILVAAAILGGVVWWLAIQLLASSKVALSLFALFGLALFLRVAVPETLVAGLVPGPSTVSAAVAEMKEALDWIRNGVPPIVPTTGVIAILSVFVFSTGALFTRGVTSGPVSAAVLPSLVIYLQFAVFDRRSAGLAWMSASAAVIALGMVAVALDSGGEAGRARGPGGEPLRARSAPLSIAMASVVAVISVALANSASGLVSEYGVAGGSGGVVGGLFGGGTGTFDRWVDLRQGVINPTGAVMFTAVLGDGSPPADSVYWRMETLDTFDGTEWSRADSTASPYDESAPTIATAEGRYQGSNSEVHQTVRIEGLRTGPGIAPTAGVPIEIRNAERLSGAIPPSEFEVQPDFSIAYPPTFQRGDSYAVVALTPNVTSDLGALATGDSGALSPLFQEAAAAGAWSHAPSESTIAATEPADLANYRELPPDTPAAIFAVAQSTTLGATTDFERAWMLQHWFRDSGSFSYSTEVTTGHEALDLAAWLTDPTSVNYRLGYCEQFAASMAVLARALGIESRVVWGFTPGTESDGAVVVTDANAHAWVELWISGFGWVPFEPTPRAGFVPASITAEFDLSEFVSESGEVLEPGDPQDPTQGPPPVRDPDPTRVRGGLWWILAASLVTLLAASPVAKAVRRRRRIARVSDGSVTAAWEEITDRLSDMGKPVSPAMTPIEVAETSGGPLADLAATYSEEVYGEREGLGSASDLRDVELWLKERYGAATRARGRVSPRSLVGRR